MPTILHISSDPVECVQLARALGAGGYSTVRAHGGLEGIALARSQAVDMAIVGATLPDLDAFTVTLRLRGLPGWEHRPIAVISDPSNSQTALAAGASGHVPLGASPSLLIRQVQRLLRGESEKADESSEIRLRSLSHRMAENLESQLTSLRKANDDLEYLARLRTEFLRNVSHELATPLTPAFGYLELLRSGALGPMDDSQRQAVEAIASAMDKLREVTGILREVSALETGAVRVRSARYTLGGLVLQLQRELELRGVPRERAASVELQVDDAQTPLTGDVTLLARAASRVVENAFKFGGPAVAVQVRASLDADDVVLRVIDDGPGIPKDTQERLGELFHQADGSSTRRHGGVGLGLAYVRRIVEAHGGRLEVASGEGELTAGGTEVTMRWKRSPSSAPLSAAS